jgi:hypothetical protein
MRMAIAAGVLNCMFFMVGHISLTYLRGFTLEKVCLIAGPELGPLAGHLLTIVRALYGPRTSGARCYDCFTDGLNQLGFYSCKADPDVWMHDCITHYEYVFVDVDVIMFIGMEPQQLFDSLVNKNGFKLKVLVHQNTTLAVTCPAILIARGAHSYVSKMLNNYETMCKTKPKYFATPMI